MQIIYDIALTVERPKNVRYNAENQTVTFQSPTSSDLCLHVRLLSADMSSWTSQLHCTTNQTGSVTLRDDVGTIKAVEVSFCLRDRPDVCGQAQNATIGQYSQHHMDKLPEIYKKTIFHLIVRYTVTVLGQHPIFIYLELKPVMDKSQYPMRESISGITYPMT